jgi:hypothetical protein
VRFVDEHDHLTPARMTLDQVLLQGPQHEGFPRMGRDGELQLVGYCIQDVLTRQRGVSEIDDGDTLGQALHEHAAEHGFATAHFAADFDDAFVVCDGVEQGVERGPAIAAAEEKIGVWRNPKGGFGESKVLKVHGGIRKW